MLRIGSQDSVCILTSTCTSSQKARALLYETQHAFWITHDTKANIVKKQLAAIPDKSLRNRR